MAKIYAENEEILLEDAENLFDTQGVTAFISDCYSAFHTQGELYVLTNVYDYLDKLGVSHRFDASKNVEFGESDEKFMEMYGVCLLCGRKAVCYAE